MPDPPAIPATSDDPDSPGTKPDWTTAEPLELLSNRYIYNADTDTYCVFLKSVQRPLAVSGTRLRAMAAAYSNWDGQPATINEICRQFEIPRPWFQEIRRIFGWTHDSEPFTAEELKARDVDELVGDALQGRRQALFQRFEVRKWQETKLAAEKWLDFEANVLQPLRELVTESVPKYEPPKLWLPEACDRYAAILNPTDHHVGRYGAESETGQSVTLESTRRVLLDATADILGRLSGHGAPERIFVPLGNDWFNADNYAGSTTKGTPQRNATTSPDMLQYGFRLAVEFLDLVAQVAPVTVFCVPGNHDRLLSSALVVMLDAWYRNDRVSVVRSLLPRQYFRYGATGVGLLHGDGPKPKDFAALFAGEAGDVWAQTTHRIVVTGHLHHERVIEHNGIVQFQCPSLAGLDSYHANEGYTLSRQRLAAILLSESDGPIASMYSKPQYPAVSYSVRV